jgi:hypothetical protein
MFFAFAFYAILLPMAQKSNIKNFQAVCIGCQKKLIAFDYVLLYNFY